MRLLLTIGLMAVVGGLAFVAGRYGTAQPPREERLRSREYRLDVAHLVDADDAQVLDFHIETVPGAMIHIRADREGGGGGSCRADAPPDGPPTSHSHITLVVDRVRENADGPFILKSIQQVKTTGARSTQTRTGSLPEGEDAGTLLHVLTQPGTYTCGVPLKLYELHGDTFRLVVEEPSP